MRQLMSESISWFKPWLTVQFDQNTLWVSWALIVCQGRCWSSFGCLQICLLTSVSSVQSCRRCWRIFVYAQICAALRLQVWPVCIWSLTTVCVLLRSAKQIPLRAMMPAVKSNLMLSCRFDWTDFVCLSQICLKTYSNKMMSVGVSSTLYNKCKYSLSCLSSIS